MAQMKSLLFLLALPLLSFAQEESSPTLQESGKADKPYHSCPDKNWFCHIAPGYFYFTDPSLHHFFKGGFTARLEADYRLYRRFFLWADAGYYAGKGHASGGGSQNIKVYVGSATLGLKVIFDLHQRILFHLGAAPRLFVHVFTNECVTVREVDAGAGIGGGFDLGFRFFPSSKYKKFYLDLLADYSHFIFHPEEDPTCSQTFRTVNISGFTAAIGLGARF